MPGTVVITGATGMLGRELVRDLLKRTDLHLALLIRRRQTAAGFLRHAVRLDRAERFRKRIRIVVGDVTEPLLGLSDAAQAQFAREVTSVLHLAADTRFDRPLSVSRAVNVAGTRNVIDLARRLPFLEHLGHVSSAYVSGKRVGVILEPERAHRAGFVNTYERSKFEAEAVLERARDVPWSIYRPSTVIGIAQTGYTSHFTTPHYALRVMHLGLAAIVPGDPTCSVDLLPTDVAAAAMGTLFTDHRVPGQVYHVVAGPEKSYTLQEIIERSYDHLQALDPAWRAWPRPRPVISSLAAFALFLEAAERSRNELVRQVTGTLRYFAGQFAYPKVFDSSATRAALPGYERSVPDIRSYYENVVAYCLRTAWGLRA